MTLSIEVVISPTLMWRFERQLKEDGKMLRKTIVTTSNRMASRQIRSEDIAMTAKKEQSKLAQLFLENLPDGLRAFATNREPLILEVPAVNWEVGNLAVFDDDVELTIVIGKLTHRHIDTYTTSEQNELERQRRAALEAIDWIKDILADRIKFRCEYSDGRLLSDSSWNCSSEHDEPGILLESTDEVREYVWSGKTKHERR